MYIYMFLSKIIYILNAVIHCRVSARLIPAQSENETPNHTPVITTAVAVSAHYVAFAGRLGLFKDGHGPTLAARLRVLNLKADSCGIF